MKTRRILAVLLGLVICTSVFSQPNNAVKLDGKDNKLAIGMNMLKDVWTLEAWIKADGNKWNDLEAIISGGGRTRGGTDNLPLVIKDGRLHNNGANISSLEILPTDKWLHVAVISDGKKTSLYVNSEMVASRDTTTTMLAAAIGAGEVKSVLGFGGMIDEVRIWKTALSQEDLKDWMNQPITPSHPEFSKLYGYYTFDELLTDMSVNRVARGHESYHIRSGRVDYYGETPLAYITESNIPNFKSYSGDQQLFNATVIASEWDSDLGEKGEQIIKIRIIVDGETNPLSLDKITFDLSKCTDLKDISKLNLYYTGSVPRSQIKEQICKPITRIKQQLVVKIKKGIKLRPGVNYFLLTADISSTAKMGNKIKVTVPTLSLSGDNITPTPDETSLDKFISINSKTDKDILKIIQWNIWHGGVHVGGKPGRLRIIDLIQESNADVVMMQESYGSQERIADSLDFQMYSASNKDNLTLYSRYPLEEIKTENPFYSNPAYMTMPSNKRILLDNIWIRYSTYHGNDLQKKYREDTLTSLMGIKRNMVNDIIPSEEPGMDVIIGGDFNSGSHLDWTKRAAHFHNGVVAVGLPTSRYMYEMGYTDSFRELNPDEVLRPGFTMAPIYGHRKSRIDYIYYKGDGIRPIFSKIVRTSNEIDDVWPGDHAAVLTTFEVVK